jgi:hypothetical protein
MENLYLTSDFMATTTGSFAETNVDIHHEHVHMIYK